MFQLYPEPLMPCQWTFLGAKTLGGGRDNWYWLVIGGTSIKMKPWVDSRVLALFDFPISSPIFPKFPYQFLHQINFPLMLKCMYHACPCADQCSIVMPFVIRDGGDLHIKVTWKVLITVPQCLIKRLPLWGWRLIHFTSLSNPFTSLTPESQLNYNFLFSITPSTWLIS